VAVTDAELIPAFLRSLPPRAVSNSEILEGTGIEVRYEVYRLARDLLAAAEIRGRTRHFSP
jgi:hypothetical protein